MSRVVRYAAGGLLAGAVALGIAALSRVPYDAGGSDPVLRLSWRARSERVQTCRQLTPAEIEALPAHMRRTEECSGRVLPYRLEVEVDGRTLLDEVVHGGGARGDRPIYVFHELPLAEGARDVSVRFTRESGPAPSSAGRNAPTPAHLELRREVTLRSGEVLLVTFDPDSSALVSRTPRPSSR